MFLEIEQKVAILTSLSQGPDPPQEQQQQRQDEPGAARSHQEAAKLLSSKLELLKAKLISFQQLLQGRQGKERTVSHREPQGQVRTVCD